jgi:hypothetical protein
MSYGSTFLYVTVILHETIYLESVKYLFLVVFSLLESVPVFPTETIYQISIFGTTETIYQINNLRASPAAARVDGAAALLLTLLTSG